MRRRIQSDSKLKIQEKKTSLKTNHSISHPGPRNSDMHLFSSQENSTNEEPKRDILQRFNTTHSNTSEKLTAPPIIPEVAINDDILLCEVASQDSGRPMSSASFSSGRPTSLSSVTSSRTSRSSDYFSSSSSAGDIQHQYTSHCFGTQFEFPSELSEMENAGKRTVLNKLIESVREEEELEVEFVDDPQYAPPANNNNSNSPTQAPENVTLVLPRQNSIGNGKIHAEVSVRDINKKLSEIDHLSPVATMAMVADPQLTHVDRVILELLETERMYVRALEDILAGYLLAIKNAPDLPISATDAQNLFGNIKDVFAFNRKFLSFLENCDSDPVQIAGLFVSKDISFDVYSQYCTNYPISVAVLTRSMKNPVLAEFFKNQQASLGHNLPLGSYLLKPVQRILKYHLILQELVKHCKADIENFNVIEQALSTMTGIAHHINEMKRKHEDAVHIQEIQSRLTNWQGNDLTSYGELVLEGELRLQGAKNERDVFLFDKMILITKKREEDILVCKTNIMCSDLILLESIKESPVSFLITPFDNHVMHPNHNHSRAHKSQYILTASCVEEKKLWTYHIKRLIIKNHHAAIPLCAQESIMNMQIDSTDVNDTKKNSRFSNISLDDGKRRTFSRFGGTMSSSTLGLNGKPRRRSDSTNRKPLQMKALRRKHDVEVSDDISSDSVPNTPTTNPGKTRFSFPRIIPSAPIKQEHVSERTLHNVAAETGGVKAKLEPAAPKAKDQKLNDSQKKEPKYKQSVIYRRHKRRTSQPITDVERRLSIRLPSGDENEEKKSVQDLDFETADELLTFSVDNNRESVSWDIQIVEAVFERFKRENSTQNEGASAENVPITISMPTYRKTLRTYSTSDESDEDVAFSNLPPETAMKIQKRLSRMASGELRLQVKSDPSNRKTGESNMEEAETGKQSLQKQKEDNEVISPQKTEEKVQEPNTVPNHTPQQASKSPPLSPTARDVFSPPLSPKVEDPDVNRHVAPKIKRSLSTQATASDRRKYFERLKELRDRRHSQLQLGSDGRSIHTGFVKELIEQHRETITSQVEKESLRSPTQKRISHGNLFSQVELGRIPIHPNDFVHSNRFSQPAISESNIERKYGNVKLRRPERIASARDPYDENMNPSVGIKGGSRKATHRSLDLEMTDHGRLSTFTTSSLPLNFTSTSSSNGNCSSSDDDTFKPASPITPKFKRLIQNPVILWRSYSEDNGTNTRRCKNLVIETTSLESHERTGACQAVEDQSKPEAPSENKLLIKEIGRISSNGEAKTDKMSEQVDYVWNDFESKSIQTSAVGKRTNSFKSSSDSLHEEFHSKRNGIKLPHSSLTIDCTTRIPFDKPISHGNILPCRSKISSPPLSPENLGLHVCPLRTTASQKPADKTAVSRSDSATAREGRERSRNGKRDGPVTGSNVMKLAHQFDKMSSGDAAPLATKPQRRSQSVGAKKHLNDKKMALYGAASSTKDIVQLNVVKTDAGRPSATKTNEIQTSAPLRSAKSKSVERPSSYQLQRQPVSPTSPVRKLSTTSPPFISKMQSEDAANNNIVSASTPLTSSIAKQTPSSDFTKLSQHTEENSKPKSTFVQQFVNRSTRPLHTDEVDIATAKPRPPPSTFVSMFCKV
ncbi:unnamed protein product [Clavelina lepadiformis]|uniref:Pleckstrin homology domain-containing family G member 1 n=1 Tax=Clavelina lepadiformis TaxID=159417 RepID=A0ABP0GMB6_CLALP